MQILSLNFRNNLISQSSATMNLNPLNTNPYKMVKHTQTIRRQPTNCLRMFDHFVGLALKGLNCNNRWSGQPRKFILDIQDSVINAVMHWHSRSDPVRVIDNLPELILAWQRDPLLLQKMLSKTLQRKDIENVSLVVR